MNILNYEVQDFENNLTIRKWLESFHISKKTINQLENERLVKLNGVNENFNTVINQYDIISIDVNTLEENEYLPYEKELDVLYEDEDVLVVNKPRNILIHPDGNSNETLGNVISNYYQSKGISRKVRHIHRLDFETSGVIIYAKNFLAHAFLDYEIRNSNIKRLYLAICEGRVNPRQSTIDKPIAKHRHISNKYIVYEKGKNARTNYFALQYKKDYSLVMLLLNTGRTHQIRVHLSDAGYPIVGDRLYGSKTEGNIMLHAYVVEFTHPRTKEKIRVEAKMPFGMKKMWDEI